MNVKHSSDRPLVSAVIPTYNCEPWIKEAVGSVLNQTYSNIEILVVDDGSTDNTRKVLSPYIKKNIIHYFYQNNQGPGSARNTGIRKAKGEYVAFLDADDLWLTEKTEKQLAVLEEKAEIKLVLSDSYIIDEKDGRKKEFRNTHPKDSEQTIIHFFQNRIQRITPTVMAERESVLSIGGFEEDLPQREDHFFLMKMCSEFQIEYIQNFLAKVRDRDKSTGGVPVEDPEAVYENYEPFIYKSVRKFPFLRNYESEAYARLHHSISYKYYLRGQRIKALKFALLGLKNNFPSFNLKLLFHLVRVLLPVPASFAKWIRSKWNRL